MSAELVPVSAAASPALVVDRSVDLTEWADRMASAGQIARAIAPTPFVPRSLRVYMRAEGSSRDEIDVGATTATVAAAVLTGTELGLSPMSALRSIDIIEGTPALRAVALRALVLAAGHELWVIESTSTRAIVSGIRAGTKHEQQSIWTMDRARSAELTGKPNWKRHPGAMLVARATAEVARLIAPDVLLGLPYVAEELEDGEIDQAPEPAPATRQRTAQRRRRAEPAPLPDLPPSEPDPEPAVVGDEPPVEPVVDEPEPVHARATNDQIRAVRRTFTTAGIPTTRGQLAEIAKITGRPVELLADLYVAEAAAVLDELRERARLAEGGDPS